MVISISLSGDEDVVLLLSRRPGKRFSFFAGCGLEINQY
ncbi:hypothetical protein CF161_01535 [Pseudomonas sp. CF161]|nr:hypothetical protein CF161_01535 [Pseudomonas sp. CF161]